MYIRTTGLCALACSILLAGAGCRKSQGNDAQGANRSLADEKAPVATVDWLGMSRLAEATNAAGFLKLWRLPESQRLKSQTLDKLALAPWRPPTTNQTHAITNYTALLRQNHSASLLRPLLDDLVQNEFYLEIRSAKPSSAQLALAVRLDRKQAGLWETSLGEVLASLPKARRTPVQAGGNTRGWQFEIPNPSPALPPYFGRVQLEHAGDWTLVGFAPGQNAVFADLLGRIQRTQTPAPGPLTNDWVQLAFNASRVSAALAWDWHLSPNWPETSLAFTGDGKNVVTTGLFRFPQALPFSIEPWNIPTNLIHEPLHSFTAAQGFKPWLSSLDFWRDTKAPDAPNQIFCWAQSGSPFLAYAAAPVPDARGVITKLGPAIMDSLNPILATNRMGQWERATNSDGVAWKRAPIIAPFVQSTVVEKQPLLFASLSPYSLNKGSAPIGTFAELESKPNLVYFDREITGPRLEAWMYITQLFRIIFRREQLPPGAAAVNWFKAVGPLLETATTTVTKTGSETLNLHRSSSLGLTACELQLLADWLESPDFPGKLFSEVAKLSPIPPRRPPQNRAQAPHPVLPPGHKR